MNRVVPPGQFNALTHPFRRSVFRLETLQVYRGSGEDDWIRLFEAGADSPPADPEQDAWEALIREHRDAGRTIQRVHVVVEPLRDYLRFEVAWQYALSVAAGENISLVAVSGNDWPHGIPRRDFWLYDDRDLLYALYSPDGTWQGVMPVDDETAVTTARRWRDAALAHAQPWHEFVASRPDLAARVPAR